MVRWFGLLRLLVSIQHTMTTSLLYRQRKQKGFYRQESQLRLMLVGIVFLGIRYM